MSKDLRTWSTLENPIQTLIDDALWYVRKHDPSWDRVQPLHFRMQVVEVWKYHIFTDILHNRVRWNLACGSVALSTSSELFTFYDFEYNPYCDKSSR